MRRFSVSAALLATLALCLSCLGPNPVRAASPGATDTAEKTMPQAKDALRADNGEQQSLPKAEHKEVIPPPPIGDEGIYIEAPNPEAGHEEEVIPPPAPDEEPSVKAR